MAPVSQISVLVIFLLFNLFDFDKYRHEETQNIRNINKSMSLFWFK